jgi:hypothetical protein
VTVAPAATGLTVAVILTVLPTIGSVLLVVTATW